MSRITAADTWKVELLSEGRPHDRARLEELRSVGYVEHDQIETILAAFPQAVASDICWAVYEWRRTMVRLPEPTIFRRIRTDRNRNKVTASEQQALEQATIGIVGMSVGHAIAAALVSEGIGGTFLLADGDTLELSNLNRVPASVLDLGMNKAVFGARRLLEVDPFLDVRIYDQGLSAADLDDFISGLDLLVEECDSLDMKLAAREAAKAHQVPVVMHTSDRGLLDVERFDLEPERPILHGLVGDLTASSMADLAADEKVPFVLELLDANEVSSRVAASFLEINRTLTTWPQLAEDVALGAAAVTAAARKIILGQTVPSGRTRVDLDAEIASLAAPKPKPSPAQRGSSRTVRAHDARRIPDELPFTELLAWAAGRAPSGGNIQPWVFRASDTRFEIRLNPQKTTAIDIAWRGSQVAVGAAILNAEIAASHRGRLGEIKVTGAGSTLSAQIALGQGTDERYNELFSAIATRTTNRNDGLAKSLPGDFESAVKSWAARFGVRSYMLTDRQQLEEVGDILGAADRLRYLDKRLHAEMMSELRWPGEDASTGIDVASLGLGTDGQAVLDLLRRSDVVRELSSWDAGGGLSELVPSLLRSSSALLVVASDGLENSSLVDAGRCVQSIWLHATKLQVGLHPISPLFLYAYDVADYVGVVDVDRADELRSLGAQFNSAVGLDPSDRPALVLRVTSAPAAVSVTPRLPWSALLTT